MKSTLEWVSGVNYTQSCSHALSSQEFIYRLTGSTQSLDAESMGIQDHSTNMSECYVYTHDQIHVSIATPGLQDPFRTELEKSNKPTSISKLQKSTAWSF